MSGDRDRKPGCAVEGRTQDFGAAVAATTADARRFADAAALDRRSRERLLVVVEEIVSNIVIHGAPPPGSEIAWRFEADGGSLHLGFSDAGTFYDPRESTVPLPDSEAAVAASALDRSGGLGWRLVLAWYDVVSCGRDGGINRLELRSRNA